ncbi:hypothetical protein CYMTET_44773 [Cymbomonas tetramitiformis]|uniref:Uncharacterized protein n=1 Tax=Cymbomonas tetramitiformis TaxID=36881 RepID=A0AAE0C0S9_9CHLO|nr:hypothetical protein CYMTET_44773 [Cymbomonas tetramitiformis]
MGERVRHVDEMGRVRHVDEMGEGKCMDATVGGEACGCDGERHVNAMRVVQHVGDGEKVRHVNEVGERNAMRERVRHVDVGSEAASAKARSASSLEPRLQIDEAEPQIDEAEPQIDEIRPQFVAAWEEIAAGSSRNVVRMPSIASSTAKRYLSVVEWDVAQMTLKHWAVHF